MTVRIPAGSTGDREYTATWKTDDPSLTILNNAMNAIGNQWETRLDDQLLPIEQLDKKLTAQVNDAIRDSGLMKMNRQRTIKKQSRLS